jgi:predicted permease
MTHDLRLAFRLLWKDRAFTATALLTLALCIGANAAIFSVIHNVLLRPLPVPDSDRILLMSNVYPRAGAAVGSNSSVPDYYDRLRETTVYEEQALFNSGNQNLDQNGTPTRVRVMRVTPSVFRLLRVPPRLGRTFSEDEGNPGNNGKVILSFALWQTQFAGDPRAVGRDLRIDGRPYTVVGVMPRDFLFLNPDVMLWTPLAFTVQQKDDSRRHSNNFEHIGRLKPGATLEQARAQIDALNAANLERFPQYKQLLINAGFHTAVTRLQDNLVRDVRSALYLLWGGAGFVLLIGGVNVANLVLVRSRARLKELATRIALGAGRLQIARQLVTESALLTCVSAAAGLAVGSAALRLLGALDIQDLPRGTEIRLDGTVVIYAVAIAITLGVILGTIPIAGILPATLTTLLREEGRTGTAGRGSRALRRALVVAQVAFAFVLLIGAGLLLASFRRVLAVDPGFSTAAVLTSSVSLPAARYSRAQAQRTFTDDALRRIRALPGVLSAGATDSIPFGDNHSDSVILAEGYQLHPGESVISPTAVRASPGYFETMSARLVRGRLFDERDTAEASRVAIIDETLAKRFWGDRDPIGRRMYQPTDINDLLAITDRTVFETVVGVIADMKLRDLTEGPQSVGTYFFPLAQDTSSGLTFAVKTQSDPSAVTGAIRGAIRSLDPELPMFDVQTMGQRLDRSLVSRRSPVLLSLSFGAIALFLSAIGIYGVLAYLVTQRTREIAIRIALGSSAGAIFELVLREGLLLIGGGLALGATGALALRKSVESQLFGVRATDPGVLAGVAGALALVALAACMMPARRAIKIDPVVALTE